MEKLSATRCLDVGRNMLATSSQHVRHKLSTSLARYTLCQGKRAGGATWKKYSQYEKKCSKREKGVHNICNMLRDIMI
jgi:hypothetical protein